MLRALDTLQRFVLSLPAFCIGLLPILVVPFLLAPIEMQKAPFMVLIGGLVLLSLSLIVVRTGFRIPALHTPFGIALVCVALISLCVGIVRSESAWQLFGAGFEVSSAAFPALLFMVFVYGVHAGPSHSMRSVYLWVASTVVASLVAIFFYMFSSSSDSFSTLAGAWPHLSFAIGLSLCFVLFRLDLHTSLRPPFVLLAGVLGVTFILFLQKEVLLSCAITSVLFSLFFYLRYRRAPLFSLVGLFISACLFFGMSSPILEMPSVIRMSGALNEVVIASVFTPPSLASVFGIGPGQFSHAWESVRPPALNATPLFEYAFWSGASTLGTLVVELGFLGLISYVAFLVLVLVRLYVSLREDDTGANSQYVLLSVGIFPLVSYALYPVHASLLLIGVCALGGAHAVEGVRMYTGRSRYLVSILLGVVGVFLAWIALLQLMASHWYVAGLTQSEAGEHRDAGESLARATDTWPTDLYARDASHALAQAAFSSLAEPDFNSLIARSVTLSDASIHAGPHNYWNWISRAGLMVSLVGAGFEEVRPQAEEALRQAHSLSPSRVEPLYLSAIYARTVGNNEQARNYVEEALLLKSDYESALVLKKELNATLSR